MRTKKEKANEPVYNKTFDKKGIKSKSHNSIEHRHFEKLEEFSNKGKVLSQKEKQLYNLENDLPKLIKKRHTLILSGCDYEKISDWDLKITSIETQIFDLKSEIDKLKSGHDEIDYLLDTYSILKQYSDLQEKEQLILNDMEQKQVTDKKQKKESLDVNLMSFLGETELIQNNQDQPIENETFLTQLEQQPPSELTLEDKYLELSQKKMELVDDYNKVMNIYVPQNIYNFEKEFCSKCNVAFIFDKGFVICSNCGYTTACLEPSGNLSYKELKDYNIKPQFTYMKITHFDDWLKRFQAKENTTISQEITDNILLELKKERINDLSSLTEDKMKRILKKLGYNKYYDHVVHIIHRLNGIPPLQLTQKIEEKLRQMFLQIQEPFEKHKPANRKNFLSYSYCLHKFFQILNLPEYTRYFTLLKSPDKLRQQDEIFRKIVKDMAESDKTVNWVFIPSI